MAVFRWGHSWSDAFSDLEREVDCILQSVNQTFQGLRASCCQETNSDQTLANKQGATTTTTTTTTTQVTTDKGNNKLNFASGIDRYIQYSIKKYITRRLL